MKRKICFLLTLAILLCTCVSCADDTEHALDQYTAAIALYTTGYQATVDFRMTVDEKSASGRFQVKVAGEDCSLKREGSTDERLYLDGVAYRRGYFHGDVYYTDSDDNPAKVKEAVTREEFARDCATLFCVNPYLSALPTLTAEDFETAEVITANGRMAFSIPLDIEAARAYFADDRITDANGTLLASFDTLGDMTDLTLTFHVTDENGTSDFELHYTFQNRGAVPAILPPENEDAYIEL